MSYTFEGGRLLLNGHAYPQRYYISPFYLNFKLLVFWVALVMVFVFNASDDWVGLMGGVGVGLGGGLLAAINGLAPPLKERVIMLHWPWGKKWIGN